MILRRARNSEKTRNGLRQSESDKKRSNIKQKKRGAKLPKHIDGRRKDAETMSAAVNSKKKMKAGGARSRKAIDTEQLPIV